MVKLLLLSILVSILLTANAQHEHPRARSSRTHRIKYEAEQQTAYWNEKAQSTLAAKLAAADQLTGQTQLAKNLIIFLGDGMSVPTVTATRNFVGDSAEQVYFDQFPFTGLSKTYCVNRQVADSACTATAYLGGVKGNYGTIGVNANVPRYSCEGANTDENHVNSIAQWAQAAGKDAGLVTSARVTHASPAGMYAHTADRNWENDAEVLDAGCDSEQTVDIARQLVEWPVGKQLKVILGGGRRNFIDATARDEEGYAGYRSDGRNLIKDWLADKQASNASAKYVWSRKGLSLLDLDKTDYLLGLFSTSHLPYNGDRLRGNMELSDPSLSELTAAALKVLQRNEQGFVLFVEGARIDMAHHDTFAHRAFEDTVEFVKAVQLAREMTNENDTLIVVTADHSHTLSIGGYPYREQEITGLADTLADDGLSYTILSYANGPSYSYTFGKEEGRKPIREWKTAKHHYRYAAYAPLSAETHGGDDVAVYASGPFAQYFSGNYEQTNIPALMARAANIGPYANIETA